MYALDATTGHRSRHVLPTSGFYSSPAISGPAGQQVLITASLHRHLYAFNLANGNTLYTHEADGAGISSSPARLAGHHLRHEQGRETAHLHHRCPGGRRRSGESQ